MKGNILFVAYDAYQPICHWIPSHLCLSLYLCSNFRITVLYRYNSIILWISPDIISKKIWLANQTVMYSVRMNRSVGRKIFSIKNRRRKSTLIQFPLSQWKTVCTMATDQHHQTSQQQIHLNIFQHANNAYYFC